jgi:glycine cleavage system H protein
VSAGGEIRFSKEHEWLVVKEGIATMGISDFAQKQLGDIVSVELPKVGAAFSQMQPMAIIDSVKASSDIYCAASGEVVQVNEQILEHPELINQSPYESGWIAKLKLSNLQEFEKLMTREQYDEFVGGGEMNKDKDKDKKGDMPTNEGQNCTEGQEDHENQRNNNNNNNNQSSRQTEHRLDR